MGTYIYSQIDTYMKYDLSMRMRKCYDYIKYLYITFVPYSIDIHAHLGRKRSVQYFAILL